MTNTARKSAAELLATPVQFLKGVGPHRAEFLGRLGLSTARDLLFFFPRDYQDVGQTRPIDQLEEGKLASVQGTVEEVELRDTGPGRSLLGVLVRQGNNYVRALWFNQSYMRDRFAPGQQLMLSGTVRKHGGRWQMAHPRTEVRRKDADGPHVGRVLPVYPLTEGLNQWQMRRIVQGVVDLCLEAVDEVFPQAFLDEHDLWPIRKALPEIHAPADRDTLTRAQRRFVFQELLVLQLALALRREKLVTGHRAPALPMTAKIDGRIRRRFPFELTTGQRKVADEIITDMARDCPMNRLLHGDVGSGKTVVALYAMLLAVAHGRQAVIMAPTEILARQHHQTLRRHLSQSDVRIGLLTGGLGQSQRRQTLADLADGRVNILVGTHAILHDDVRFFQLALVVIDEQHKFGVRQRATLRGAGLDPHYLVMTATPIPRTMALTQFGDLDMSTLRDSPPGRQVVHSYFSSEAQRAKWWDFFRRKLREGRQGYVVTPLVQQSETLQVDNVQASYEQLANGELEAFRLDLIHGRMSAAEKEAIMNDFRSGRTQVLVATSVVEVGVDIPNATLMTIESGERFGLAQLHQLRGRVSRGTHPAYVCVFGDLQTEESRRRITAFTETTDGFKLADIDFELRGPGELLGTRQHGLPPMRVANLLRDANELDQARRCAQALVLADPGLSNSEYTRLRRMVIGRYGEARDLGDIG